MREKRQFFPQKRNPAVQGLRTNTYKDTTFYDWKSIPDVKDNNFEPFIARIMKSSQSYFITGPGGSGKTTSLKQLQEVLTKQDKKHTTLCPTNLAALLVGGVTIQKFSTKLKKQSQVENLDLDYILIDESIEKLLKLVVCLVQGGVSQCVCSNNMNLLHCAASLDETNVTLKSQNKQRQQASTEHCEQLVNSI
jgi:energy-coupling factor transporter ATP-binding protein EcfA2